MQQRVDKATRGLLGETLSRSEGSCECKIVTFCEMRLCSPGLVTRGQRREDASFLHMEFKKLDMRKEYLRGGVQKRDSSPKDLSIVGSLWTTGVLNFG
jgi:hypothetical protein